MRINYLKGQNVEQNNRTPMRKFANVPDAFGECSFTQN